MAWVVPSYVLLSVPPMLTLALSALGVMVPATLATDGALRERMSTAALSRAAVSTLDDVVLTTGSSGGNVSSGGGNATTTTIAGAPATGDSNTDGSTEQPTSDENVAVEAAPIDAAPATLPVPGVAFATSVTIETEGVDTSPIVYALIVLLVLALAIAPTVVTNRLRRPQNIDEVTPEASA